MCCVEVVVSYNGAMSLSDMWTDKSVASNPEGL